MLMFGDKNKRTPVHLSDEDTRKLIELTQELRIARKEMPQGLDALNSAALSDVRKQIAQHRAEATEQVNEIRNIVADLFDTVEDLKREFVSLERDQAYESGSQLREAIEKVSNKTLKDELINKLYAFEDKMPHPTRVQRLAPKDNPLRSPLERYERGY